MFLACFWPSAGDGKVAVHALSLLRPLSTRVAGALEYSLLYGFELWHVSLTKNYAIVFSLVLLDFYSLECFDLVVTNRDVLCLFGLVY